MIVRDESAVIERCLLSIRPYITHFAIIDTGSVDNTVGLVNACLSDIEGQVSCATWSDDFSVHRNQSLELSRGLLGPGGGQLLFIDADETLEGNLALSGANDCGSYDAWNWWAVDGDFRYRKLAIAHTAIVEEWRGARHEFLCLRADCEVGFIDTACIRYGHDGSRRRDLQTMERDIRHLSNVDGSDSDFRSHYFQARSFEAMGSVASAMLEYDRALELAGTEASDDRWQCLWGKARAYAASQNHSISTKADLYFQAHVADVSRAEPLLALAEIAYEQAQFADAMALATHINELPLPAAHTAMYDHSAYTWRAQQLVRQIESRMNGAG